MAAKMQGASTPGGGSQWSWDLERSRSGAPVSAPGCRRYRQATLPKVARRSCADFGITASQIRRWPMLRGRVDDP
jgi:hypothetical protein